MLDKNKISDLTPLVNAAKAARIPVTSVTETPPPRAAFQDWQADELQGLQRALASATGR